MAAKYKGFTVSKMEVPYAGRQLCPVKVIHASGSQHMKIENIFSSKYRRKYSTNADHKPLSQNHMARFPLVPSPPF